MNFGLFEPLFGKQIPKQHNFSPEQTGLPDEIPAASRAVRNTTASVTKSKINTVTRPEATVINPINNQLGELFGELDRSKVTILILAVAIAIMFVFFFYLNTRQKSQKQIMLKMQKQLKRLRG